MTSSWTHPFNSAVEIEGIFQNSKKATACLSRMLTKRLPVHDVTVKSTSERESSANSTIPEDSTIWGAGIGVQIGIIICLWRLAVEPTWGLLHSIGVVYTALLGAILGCMFGTITGAMIGSIILEFSGKSDTSKHQTSEATSVDLFVDPPSYADDVRKVMLDCGAETVSIRPKEHQE